MGLIHWADHFDVVDKELVLVGLKPLTKKEKAIVVREVARLMKTATGLTPGIEYIVPAVAYCKIKRLQNV